MHLIRPQERFRRGKTLRPQSDRSDQILQRTSLKTLRSAERVFFSIFTRVRPLGAPESIVIVNNRNQRNSWHPKSVAPSQFIFGKTVATVEPITMAVLVWF
jgi:hypothetical protein